MADPFDSPVPAADRPGSLRVIARAATSIAAFVGRALKGPVNEPVAVRSFAEYTRAFPGERPGRQPLHTVYGGAHLFKADTAPRLGALALKSLDEYAPDPVAFGSAIGLTAVSPWPHMGLSPVVLAVIAALWVAIVQVVGFGAAGYVAGRVRNSWRSVTPHEQRFRDGMHGFIAWALALLMGLLWIGQGFGIIRWPSESFMIDMRPWATRGLVLALIGVAMIVIGKQRQRRSHGKTYAVDDAFTNGRLKRRTEIEDVLLGKRSGVLGGMSHRCFETCKREVRVFAAFHRPGKVEARRIAFESCLLNGWTARHWESKQLSGFVECFAQGIIDRGREAAIVADALDQKDLGMTA